MAGDEHHAEPTKSHKNWDHNGIAGCRGASMTSLFLNGSLGSEFPILLRIASMTALVPIPAG